MFAAYVIASFVVIVAAMSLMVHYTMEELAALNEQVVRVTGEFQ